MKTAFAAALFGLILVSAPAAAADMSKGEYLARAGDCVVCHTISEGAPYAGGLKMNTPVGPIFTTNITPDPDTGIGHYSYEDFARALRQGVARDGRRLYPAMPYPSYARIDDDDMRALYDYFMQEVKPVRQTATPNEIRPILDQRWPLAIWNWVGAGAPFKANPNFDSEWNRGAYLVQGLGHCGACHTPRGLLFQEKGLDEKSGAFVAGANLDNWSAPNLRGDLNTGLGRWTRQDIAQYLKTGRNNHGAAFGAMRDVVVYSTRYLADEDLNAMAKYLKSLPPSIDRSQPVWVYDNRTSLDFDARRATAAGSSAFLRQCSSCHGTDGKGAEGQPPLAGNPSVLDPDPTSLINIVLNGAPKLALDDLAEPDAMPQFRTLLNDQEIADVIGFIRGAWGNRASTPTNADVAALRAATTLNGERTLIWHMR